MTDLRTPADDRADRAPGDRSERPGAHAGQRRVGVAAWLAAGIATILGPVHALARFETEVGSEDLENPLTRAWAEPAAEALRPLLAWSDPDTVYLTYGKIWLPVLIAAIGCAFVVRRRREPRGVERWGWAIALVGYVVLTTGILVTYWTPWLEPGFMFLVVPGLLVSLIGSTVLGVTLIRRGHRPRTTGWLLALWLPLAIALSAVIALGAATLPMLWAWGAAGRRLRA